MTTSNNKKSSSSSMRSAPSQLLLIIVAGILFAWSLPLSLAMAQQQQQQTPTTAGTGAATTPPSTTTPSLTPSPPLTTQEQQQQIRLQNVIAGTTLNLQETQKQISGVVFTPRWSQPVWVNANSVAVLVAYCLPGEFADSGQEILGGFELEILESYGVALPQGFMVWMAVVGNEDVQNRRLPAALGVMCASDLNKPETRVLSPEKQQEINNINEQFVNIQNTQINDIDNVINVINTVTTTTTITPPPTPPSPQNSTGGGAGATTLAAAPVQQDTTPPTLIVPEDMVVNATGEQGAEVTYTVTAQDDRDGTATLEEDGITVTQDNATYAQVAPGTMTGQTMTGQTQTGGIAPPPITVKIGISCNLPSGSIFTIGTSTVECSAKDAAGNGVTASFTVTVNGPTQTGEDTTPPTISVPGPIEVVADSEQGAEVTYSVTAQDNVDGTATLEEDEDGTLTQDNVGGNINIYCEPPSGIVFPVGITPVTCIVYDASGNQGRSFFEVEVRPPDEDEEFLIAPEDEAEGETSDAEEQGQEEPPPLAEELSPPPASEEENEGETSDAEGEPPPPASEEENEGETTEE